MFDSPEQKVMKWLEKKIENSEKAIDHGWEIKVIEEGTMEIDTDQMPFKIIVRVEDKITYIAFLTAIYMRGLDESTAKEAFRNLLHRNKTMELTKFYLVGDDDRLAMRTDLYTQHMNKEEFNTALESVILGGRWLIAWFGQTEDENRTAKEMAELGSAELINGTAPEQVALKMVEAGYPEDLANKLVENLMFELGLKEREYTSTETQEKPEKEDTSAVDNYIW